MKIRIYQINLERDGDRIAFQDLENLSRFQQSADINCAIYDRVYEGDVDCATLEDVFQKFNLEHPPEYTGRSLSVSDIVEVVQDPYLESGFYFCGSIGFRRVEFDPALAQVKESSMRVVICEPGKLSRIAEIQPGLESLQQILCTLNYVVNGEKLSLGDIVLNEPAEKTVVPQARETVQNEEAVYEEVHNTLAVEQTLMNMIRKGDTRSLKEWIASAPAVHAGPMAREHLRQYKNTFIVSTTLAARSAIRGGMDVEEALSTSDLLIRNCEALQDVQSIMRLQVNMFLTYTEQVERLRKGIPPTHLAIAVSAWVQRHLSESMDTEKLSRELHYSRAHLSRRFKEETGMTLTDYILTKKSEEAARLLAFTDKSLISISDYLGFSSQSHFTRVFKKYIGMTPSEYRSR